MTGFFVVCY